jgi:hypothetical protein
VALHTSNTTGPEGELSGKNREAHGTFFAEMESPQHPAKKIRIQKRIFA